MEWKLLQDICEDVFREVVKTCFHRRVQLWRSGILQLVCCAFSSRESAVWYFVTAKSRLRRPSAISAASTCPGLEFLPLKSSIRPFYVLRGETRLVTRLYRGNPVPWVDLILWKPFRQMQHCSLLSRQTALILSRSSTLQISPLRLLLYTAAGRTRGEKRSTPQSSACTVQDQRPGKPADQPLGCTSTQISPNIR